MIVARQDRRFERTPVRGNVHQMVDLSVGGESAKPIAVRAFSRGPEAKQVA